MADLPYSAFQVGDLVVSNPQGDSPYLLTELNVGGKPDTDAGDKARPREDGLFFGRDQLTGRLIPVGGSVSTDGQETARNAWEALTQAWDAESTRLTPGATVPLRVRMRGGPSRVVYGRPRELDPKDDPGFTLLDEGRIDWVGQFRCIDHLFYDDVEQTSAFSIASTGTPGLRSPLKSPLTSRVPGAGDEPAGRVTIGGTQPAWPAVTIYGPIVNPVWSIIGFGFLALSLTLRDDEYVTISTAPWARFVRKNGTANVAGALTATSMRLSRARLTPGEHSIVLRGISDAGTARAVTSWRNAYTAY